MKRIFLLAFLAAASGAWAQNADPTENDFFGADAPTVAENKPTTDDPTKQFDQQSAAKWGGTIKSDATWQPGWINGYPGDSAATWRDALSYDLLTTAFLDSRPDKDFRFRFSLQAGYPFTNDKKVMAANSTPTNPATTTVQGVQLPRITLAVVPPVTETLPM